MVIRVTETGISSLKPYSGIEFMYVIKLAYLIRTVEAYEDFTVPLVSSDLEQLQNKHTEVTISKGRSICRQLLSKAYRDVHFVHAPVV